ncbi:MAG: uroporphyrinogen decarboxylase family protein [Sedimentisphaerales bacterium]
MNERQRWLETLTFGTPDFIPLEPGHGRESTLERWHQEGLPCELGTLDAIHEAYRQAGGIQKLPTAGTTFAVDEKMIPQFERKVISKGERSQIVQDWKGNICEIGNEYTVDHLGGTNRTDFVTRRWIKCPVENRKDWADMKKRYDPLSETRLPQNPAEKAKALKNRVWPIQFHFSGPFWQLREWLGFENLCMMLHDDPAFIEEMIEFWDDYITKLMKHAFEYVIPDSVWLSEDMAYKSFSMISPNMARKFLLPTWKKWGQIILGAGVPVYAMDSDGFIGELIPLWIEAGINACDPIEVAAGNDIVQLRKQFGRTMAYRGGIDKRCIAQGGKVIEDEIRRIRPVVRSGGYIPGCDHGVPHDISWQNFIYYVKLLAKETGWL